MTPHEYAASLASRGLTRQAISQATGLSESDLSHLQLKERRGFNHKPLPSPAKKPLNLKGPPSAQRVFLESCNRLQVEPEKILSNARKRPLAWPRQEIMFDLFTKLPHMSAPSIGRLMNRDHTTVIHGIRAHCARIGMPYEDAVAIRCLNSKGPIWPSAIQYIGRDAFEAALARQQPQAFSSMMERYGESMRGGG